MWQCPKCGTAVQDSLKWCWICGTSPDGSEYPHHLPAGNQSDPLAVPLSVIRKIDALKRPRGPAGLPEAVGVPRRFGLDKLMLITAFFAVLFALMTWLGAHPVLFVSVSLFVVVVGLAQAVLFSGKSPRKASIVAGSAVGVLGTAGGFVWVLWTERGHLAIGDIFAITFGFALMAIFWAFSGGVLGYLAGCLIAGIFLRRTGTQAEADRRRPAADASGIASPDEPSGTPNEEDPFA